MGTLIDEMSFQMLAAEDSLSNEIYGEDCRRTKDKTQFIADVF
jgi:hypothetical protein